MATTITTPAGASEADLHKRLASIEAQLVTLSERRRLTQQAVRKARAEWGLAGHPASGTVAERVVAQAAAAQRVATALAADAEAATAMGPLQAEQDSLRVELARRASAAEAAKSVADLQRDLDKAEQAMTQRSKDLQAARNAAANAQAKELREQSHVTEQANNVDLIGNREKTAAQWRAAREHARAAYAATDQARREYELVRARRDQLGGEIERRGRQFRLPTPAFCPVMPDERLSAAEYEEALQALSADIRQRQRRAGDRLREAEAAKDKARRFDAALPVGVLRARLADATVELRLRQQDAGALSGRLLEAQRELRRLERQAVAV